MRVSIVPSQWLDYKKEWGQHLEELSATLYDTEIYYAQATRDLAFFQSIKKSGCWSNMYCSGMLPNPHAFLVQSIRINGITSNIRLGACQLVIGVKHWNTNPAWTYGLKEKGFKCSPGLMIPPLVNFRFQISWEKSEQLGRGLTGLEKPYQPIQVVLFGQLLRSRV